jgi:prolyl 4-hydroxylase
MFEALVRTLPGLLSTEECSAEITRAEALGFDAAPITTVRGFVHRPEVRNNQRVMRDDPEQAARLWERLRGSVPPELEGARAVGLNERFRLYRYEPGQYFRVHSDGAFVRGPTERSRLTLLIYLNEGFTGGETQILDWGPVHPRTGLGLLFQHELFHESVALRSGRKYVLRSDVMYARTLVAAS